MRYTKNCAIFWPNLYVLCYYANNEVTLFMLKMEFDDDSANVNLWNSSCPVM